MSKALAIDFSTSNTGYAFRNPLTNEYVVGSVAGGKSKDPLERAKIIADGITEIIEHYNLFILKNQSSRSSLRETSHWLGRTVHSWESCVTVIILAMLIYQILNGAVIILSKVKAKQEKNKALIYLRAIT